MTDTWYIVYVLGGMFLYGVWCIVSGYADLLTTPFIIIQGDYAGEQSHGDGPQTPHRTHQWYAPQAPYTILAHNTPPITLTILLAVSWRSEGIKHRKNEIFLDVIEKLNLLVSRYMYIYIHMCYTHTTVHILLHSYLHFCYAYTYTYSSSQ